MSRAVPLSLTLVPSDPRPINRQLTDGIRLAITTGQIRSGDRLPSVRALAVQLLVNPNTIAKAYLELSTEGWLNGQHGHGMLVAGQPKGRLSQKEKSRRLREASDIFVAEIVAIGCSSHEAMRVVNCALENLWDRKVGEQK